MPCVVVGRRRFFVCFACLVCGCPEVSCRVVVYGGVIVLLGNGEGAIRPRKRAQLEDTVHVTAVLAGQQRLDARQGGRRTTRETSERRISPFFLLFLLLLLNTSHFTLHIPRT